MDQSHTMIKHFNSSTSGADVVFPGRLQRAGEVDIAHVEESRALIAGLRLPC